MAGRPAPAAIDPAITARKWWIFATIATGTLLASFNNSSLNAILPIVREDLQVSVAAVQWAVMAFLLVNSSLALTWGRVGDLSGHKRLYLIGLAVFTGGVLLASTAGSLGWLIGSRVLQAIGGGMMVAAAPAITTLAFPAHQRGRVLGFQATTVYVGLGLGPSVGGFIADTFGWRAVFLFCAPMAIVTATLAWKFLPAFKPKVRTGTFDLVGALLFMIGMSALLYAISHGQEWGWTSGATLGVVVLGLAIVAAFVAWEFRCPSPMLDLSLFRIQLFRISVVSSILNFVCFFGIFFLMPFYLIVGRGWTAGQAGSIFFALPLTMASVVTISGWASDRIGSRALASTGMIVLAFGLFLLGWIGGETAVPAIAGALVVCGIGIGLFTAPNNSAIMGSAPIERRGVASGVVATARSVGMVLGIAVTGAVFTSLLAVGGGTIESSSPAFLEAARWTFWVLAGVALLGAVTSYSRGSSQPTADLVGGSAVRSR